MKKILLFLLTMCLVFSAAACKETPGSKPASAGGSHRMTKEDTNGVNVNTNEPVPVEVLNSVTRSGQFKDSYPIIAKAGDSLLCANNGSIFRLSEKDGSVLETLKLSKDYIQYKGILSLGNYLFMNDPRDEYLQVYDYTNKKELQDFLEVRNFGYIGDKIILCYYPETDVLEKDTITVDIRDASNMGKVVETIIKGNEVLGTGQKLNNPEGFFYKGGFLYFVDPDKEKDEGDMYIFYKMDIRTNECKEIYRAQMFMHNLYIDDENNLYFFGLPDVKNSKDLLNKNSGVCKYNLDSKVFDSTLYDGTNYHYNFFVLDGYIYGFKLHESEDQIGHNLYKIPVKGGHEQKCCDADIEVEFGKGFAPCVFGDYIYYPQCEKGFKYVIGRYNYKTGASEAFKFELERY